MRTGIVAAFGQQLVAPDLDLLENLGFSTVRNSLVAQVPGTVDQFKGRKIRPVFLLPTVDIMFQVVNWLLPYANQVLGPAGYDVEIGNEPDIASNGWGKPTDYGHTVNANYTVWREFGFEGRILAGGVSNLSNRGLSYLTQAYPLLPAGVTISFHDYNLTEADLIALRQLVGGRDLFLSEFGWSSGPGMSDIQIASLAQAALRLAESYGVGDACWYQLNDAPIGDKFGIRTITGQLKPVASVFANVPVVPLITVPPLPPSSPYWWEKVLDGIADFFGF